MLGYARSDSRPCRLGPTHAVIALVSAPGSTLADSHVAWPRGRSEEWYYKRGFWPRPFHYTEENRQRMLDPIEAPLSNAVAAMTHKGTRPDCAGPAAGP